MLALVLYASDDRGIATTLLNSLFFDVLHLVDVNFSEESVCLSFSFVLPLPGWQNIVSYLLAESSPKYYLTSCVQYV